MQQAIHLSPNRGPDVPGRDERSMDSIAWDLRISTCDLSWRQAAAWEVHLQLVPQHPARRAELQNRCQPDHGGLG